MPKLISRKVLIVSKLLQLKIYSLQDMRDLVHKYGSDVVQQAIELNAGRTSLQELLK